MVLAACQHLPHGVSVSTADAVVLAREDAKRHHLSLEGLILVVGDHGRQWEVNFNVPPAPPGTHLIGGNGYAWLVDKRTGTLIMLPVSE